MKRTDFAVDIPRDLIASEPVPTRSASRMLCMGQSNTHFEDLFVSDLLDVLRPGDVVIANNTQVIPARLRGKKLTGGRVEVFIDRILDVHSARVLIKSSKLPAVGSKLLMDGQFRLEIKRKEGIFFFVSCEQGLVFLDLMNAYGHVPLPPYIDRPHTEDDKAHYQTVFAKLPGAVAAPTAGLHLDKKLIGKFHAAGVVWKEITLHVGVGTFFPVRCDEISSHRMHSEIYNISPDVWVCVEQAKREGRRIIAIGTTTLRALESFALEGNHISGSDVWMETDLFISPGFTFKITDCLLTNFHLSESSLLMLVSAFGGHARVMRAYHHAIQSRYRFFSYGDACWIERMNGV